MGKEMAFVFLQEVYAVCGPTRVAAVSSVEEELLIHANIDVHFGKTHVWNTGGVLPVSTEELTRAARQARCSGMGSCSTPNKG